MLSLLKDEGSASSRPGGFQTRRHRARELRWRSIFGRQCPDGENDLAEVFAAERGAHGLTHRDDGVVAGGGGIFADVDLDSIGDGEPAPAKRCVVIGGRDCVRSSAERRRERLRDAFFECVSGDLLHLALYRVETLSLALANFDREQLKEMPVAIRRAGTRSFGVIEQSARNIEPNGARGWRCASGRVGRPNAGRVN